MACPTSVCDKVQVLFFQLSWKEVFYSTVALNDDSITLRTENKLGFQKAINDKLNYCLWLLNSSILELREESSGSL